MTCGIYKISFEGTDKVYIGLSKNIESRIRSHRNKAIHDAWPEKLQQAFNTYGTYSIDILCECEPSELETYEKEAIEIFNSIENGFNTRGGGTCGSGSYGEINGRSKYSDKSIEQAFKLLVTTELTHKEIAETCSISREVVTHISAQTGHKWLKDRYPTEYALLETKKYSRNIQTVVIRNMLTQEVICVNSIKQLQQLTNAKYSTITNFLSGRNKTLDNTWCHAEEKPKPNKKPVYTLVNLDSGQACSFSSKLKFFTQYGLTNRRKFSEFLCESNLNKDYQNWKLVSIGS